MTTAAVIIIGNEILSGKFADENGPYAIRRLRELGVDLERMVVIPDTPEVIAAEVSLASQRFDWVFTSGGVGPTHDDVTLESVAAGLGESLVLHPDLLALLDGFGIERTPSSLRMARVPESTRLIKGNERGFFCCCGVSTPRAPRAPHSTAASSLSHHSPRAGLRLLHVHFVRDERFLPSAHSQAQVPAPADLA